MSKLILECLGLIETPSNIPDFCKRVRENGATGIRFIALLAWDGRRNPYIPFKQVGEWEARPETEFSVMYPFYDLSQWNDAFWERFDSILYHMIENDLAPWVGLHDRCSWEYRKYDYPFFSCIQKFPDRTKDSKISSGSFGENLWPWHKKWYHAVVDRLDYYCPGNYYVEIMNEYILDREVAANNIWFHRESAAYLKSIGVPKSRIVTSTVGFEDIGPLEGLWKELASHVGILSAHGIVNQAQLDKAHEEYVVKGGCDPKTIFISGDGGDGGTGDWDLLGRKQGLGTADAPGIMQYIMDKGLAGYGYMPRNIKTNAHPEIVTDANLEPLHAAAKVAGTIPPPEPPIPPVPPPPEPPKESWWARLWRWLFGPNSLWRKIFG